MTSLESLNFICVYKSNGCEDEINYKDLPYHVERCSFKPIECP